MTPRIPEETALEVQRLFVAIRPELQRYASKLTYGDHASAEDLVQDTFHDALAENEIGGWDLNRQRAWLFTVTHNKAFDKRRRDSQLCVKVDLEDQPSGRNDTQKVLNSIILERCWEVLRTMSPRQYQVAYLRWHEGWSVRKIAKFLNMKKETVRVHLFNARKQLVKTVGPDVFAEGSGARHNDGLNAIRDAVVRAHGLPAANSEIRYEKNARDQLIKAIGQDVFADDSGALDNVDLCTIRDAVRRAHALPATIPQRCHAEMSPRRATVRLRRYS